MLNSIRFLLILLATVHAAFTGIFLAFVLVLHQELAMDGYWLFLVSTGILAVIALSLPLSGRVSLFLLSQSNFRIFHYSSLLVFVFNLGMITISYLLFEQNETTAEVSFYFTMVSVVWLAFFWFFIERMQKHVVERLLQSTEISNTMLNMVWIFSILVTIFFFLSLHYKLSSLESYLFYTIIISFSVGAIFGLLKLSLKISMSNKSALAYTGMKMAKIKDTYHKLAYLNNPYILDLHLEQTILDSNQQERNYLYQFMGSYAMVDKLDELKNIKHTHLPDDNHLAQLILSLQDLNEKIKGIDSPYDFVENSKDITLISAVLRTQIHHGELMVIQKCLSDLRPEVRKQAILVCAYINNNSYLPTLIEQLKDPDYSRTALLALNYLGQQSLAYAKSGYFRNRENFVYVDALIKLCILLKSNESLSFLISLLNEPQRAVKIKAAEAIIDENFSIELQNEIVIKQLIDELIATYVFNQNVLSSLDPSDKRNDELYPALKSEINNTLHIIFKLLRGITSHEIIDYYYKNLNEQDAKGQLTALAMLDIHFPISLRVKLKLLAKEKSAKKLSDQIQKDYLTEKIDFEFKNQEEAILQLIKRDYNKISFWLRTCAMESLANRSIGELPSEIIAELFNPKKLVQEIVAKTIYQLSPDYFLLYLRRFSKQKAEDLSYKIESNLSERKIIRDDNFLDFDQIKFLHKSPLFDHFIIKDIADIQNFFSVKTLTTSKQYLNFNPYYPNGYWIIEHGELHISYRGDTILKARTGSIIDMSFLRHAEKNTLILTNKTDVRYLFIEYHTLNALIPEKPIHRKQITTINLDDFTHYQENSTTS